MNKIKGLKIIFSKNEIKTALARMKKAMEIGYVASGENVKGVEDLMKDITKSKYAIATSSGTSALECIFSALKNLYKVDYALITANTVMATVMSVERAGLKYDLVGISDNLMIDRDEVFKKIKKSRRKTGVVVSVHIGGLIESDFGKFVKKVESLGWYVVEDCAHAVGSYLNRSIGENNKKKSVGTFGIAGAFSFFSTKVLTGGEGGCVITKDRKLAKYCEAYRNFGKEKLWTFDCKFKGYNHRMNELAACLIRTELENIDMISSERNSIFFSYISRLSPVARQYILNFHDDFIDCVSLHYKIILIDDPLSVYCLVNYLKRKGIELPSEVYKKPLSNFGILGSHTVPMKTTNLCESHICLPIYRGMTNKDIDYVCKAINKYYGQKKSNKK